MRRSGEVRVAAFRSVGALILLLVGSWAVFAADVAIRAPHVEGDASRWGFDGAATMSGEELGKMIEEEIGAGNYQQVTVLLDTCHSGAGLDTIAAQLSGSHNLVAACKSEQTASTRRKKGDGFSGFFPGFFDSIATDPDKPVKDHMSEGDKNDHRHPQTPDEEQQQKYKYEMACKYRKAENEQRKKDGKKPKPELPAWDAGGRDSMISESDSEQSADDPQNKKIVAGTASNHAIIFQTDGRKESNEATEKAKKALEDAGFGSNVTHMTPLNAGDINEVKKAEQEKRFPNLRDDLATSDNLRKKLRALKPEMNTNEHLLVLIVAHGTVTATSEHTNAAAGIGGGHLFDHLASTDTIGDFMIADLLAEEAFASDGTAVGDLPWYRHWDSPSLVIQTAEEDNPSGQPVSVLLNGLLAGAIELDPDGFGFHRVTLEDRLLEQLVDATDLTGGLAVSFGFDSGDSFRLATPEDVEVMGGAFGYFGMRMEFNLDGDDTFVPEPATMVLVTMGFSAVMLLRRRRRH